MFKFFKSKSAKETPVSNIQEDLHLWKYIDVSELDDYSDAVKDIYDKKYTGIIIRNVCSQEEIAKMKTAIEGIDPDITIPTGVGHSYPRHFSQLVKPDDDFSQERDNIKAYFSQCEQLPETFTKLTNSDFPQKIQSTLEKVAGGRTVEIPKGFDKEGRYASGSIRVNYPGQGFIMVHCGNYFQQEFPVFYDHLKTEVNVKDQLSYFLTVNPAEIGGELTLFDVLWENGQTKESARHDDEIFLADGESLDTSTNSSLKRMKVKPEAGDLLIFSGGPIWHKVELVEGTQNRITIGGFLAFTEDEKTVKYWT